MPRPNGPAAAFGPLREQTLYTGVLHGADSEDWLQYWHVPRWDAPMEFRSACATRVELHSTANDTLIPAALLAQFALGPAGVRNRYSTVDRVVRRMLVRVVRTDGGIEACDWHVDAQVGYAASPPTPKLTLQVERKAGRAVAVTVRARIQSRGGASRPALIEVSGAVRRAIRVSVPQSGVITRRIELPAGRKGALRFQVSAEATVRRPAISAVNATVKVLTPRPVARRPVVRRPSPPPRRPVVKRPRTPAMAVHRFLRNPPAVMKGILKEAKFARGYELGPTKRRGNGWAQICAIAKIRSNPSYPNNPAGAYYSFRLYTFRTYNTHSVRWVEGPNFVWPTGYSPVPASNVGYARCPSRPDWNDPG